MRRSASTAVLALAVATSACASSADRKADIGQSQGAIINGVIDNPEKYPSALSIMIDLGGGMGAGCTGTLISPHVMITARHCVSNFNDSSQTFGADFAPSQFMVFYGPQPGATPNLEVAKIVHTSVSDTIIDNDFAMLVFKTAANRPFAPIRLKAPPTVGETVAVAGFGITTTDPATPTSYHARYRRENLTIKYVGPNPKIYDYGNNEIVLGESTCHGDSGGPVYDQGTGALLALTSRGGNGTGLDTAAGCTNTATHSAQNIFSRVDAYADLIKKTVADVGETVWEEGEPKPEPPSTPVPDPGMLGSTCGGSADCASKLCVAKDDKQVCSQACSDSKPCPSGFDCVSGYCFATPPATTDPNAPAADPNADPNAATDDGGTVKKGACSTGGGSGDPVAALLLAGAGWLLTRRRKTA